MIISACALKVFATVLAGGALASVVVPIAITMHSVSTTLDKFPEGKKIEYQNKCRLLIKDESDSIANKKYLLVCRGEEGYEKTNFYYYSEGNDPIEFKELKNENNSGEQQTKVTVTLFDAVRGGGHQVEIVAKTDTWTNLVNKSLADCDILNKESETKQWFLKCSGTSHEANIPLTKIFIP